MNAVRVAHLRKSYGAVHAVNDVSFDVERGEIFALLGPNGAGKTTTIEILEGFRARDAGDVEILGVDPDDHRKQRWLHTQLGVVLQELAVEPLLSVRQVLARNAGYYPAPRRVNDVIELIGLSEKADTGVKTLSGGSNGGWTLAWGSWVTLRCCSWMSRRRGSTPRVAEPRGTCFASSLLKARP